MFSPPTVLVPCAYISDWSYVTKLGVETGNEASLNRFGSIGPPQTAKCSHAEKYVEIIININNYNNNTNNNLISQVIKVFLLAELQYTIFFNKIICSGDWLLTMITLKFNGYSQ